MNTLSSINVDFFKKTFYKAFLPLEEIDAFLTTFEERELEKATQLLIKLFDVSVTHGLLANMSTTQQKQEFLRLLENDPTNPVVLDFLVDTFPSSTELITQLLERTLLSAKRAIM